MSESIADLVHLDAIALSLAWTAKRADMGRARQARQQVWEELCNAHGFDRLTDNERSKVPGAERYFDFDELHDELRDEADAIAELLAEAPCRTPQAAAATLSVAAARMVKHNSTEAALVRRVAEEASYWAGVPPNPSG